MVQSLLFDNQVMVKRHTDEYERFLLTEINLVATPAPSYCNQLWNGLLFRPMREGIRLPFLIKLLQRLVCRGIHQFNPLDSDRGSRRCRRCLRRSWYM